MTNKSKIIEKLRIIKENIAKLETLFCLCAHYAIIMI